MPQGESKMAKTKRKVMKHDARALMAAEAVAGLCVLADIVNEDVTKSYHHAAAEALFKAAFVLAEDGVLDMLTAVIQNMAKACGYSTRGTLQEVAARLAE
jgi:hypothetical protein